MVNIFYILDFDRCLFDSSRFQDEFIRCVTDNHHVLTREQIQDTQRATEASGGSFDTVSFVREYVGQSEWQEIKKLFLNEMKAPKQRESLYFGDAKVFIAELKRRQLPFGILTYGGQEWQQMKLQALGFDTEPHIITDTKHKGKIITSYYDSTKKIFTLPEALAGRALVAQNVCLVDDKGVSFEGMPPQTTGYWLVPDKTNVALRHQGSVGENVKQIARLSEVLDLINYT